MDTIWIQKIEPTDSGWRLQVEVGKLGEKALDYQIELDREYYKMIVPKRTIEELMRGTFKFLLAREPKESILRKFNLRVVQEYFPDFEKEIKKELSG